MLTEETIVDKIEVIDGNTEDGDSTTRVQIRVATVIKRDDKEISRSFHRKVLSDGDDISGEEAKVQSVCNAVWSA